MRIQGPTIAQRIHRIEVERYRLSHSAFMTALYARRRLFIALLVCLPVALMFLAFVPFLGAMLMVIWAMATVEAMTKAMMR